MSWIFGKKKKEAEQISDSQKSKRKGQDDFLLGADGGGVDYMSSGMHKKGDDKQFANELAELGFDVEVDDEPLTSGHQSKDPDLLEMDLSAYHVPEVREEDMTLTEEDMNDPELLAAFSAIGSEGDLLEISPSIGEKNATEIPVIEDMDIDSLQVLALALTNEGRKNEALEVMKRIRYIKYADKIQDTVDKAQEISSSSHGGRAPVSPLNEEIPPACAPYGFPGDAKQFAVKLKKAGYQSEAVQWLRYAKQVESGSQILQRVETTPSAVQVSPSAVAQTVSLVAVDTAPGQPEERAPPPPLMPVRASVPRQEPLSGSVKRGPGDVFAPLESALEEAISYHFKKASAAKKDLTALIGSEDITEDTLKGKSAAFMAQRAKFRTLASDQMRLYKQYTQELAVLQSRRSIPGVVPPLFRWETTQISTPVENTHLAEDQIELIVNGAHDMEVLLSSQSQRTISISYNMGIPRDNPITGKLPAVKYVDGEGCSWDFKIVLPFKRARSLHNLMERKKVTFEIVLHRGMFYGGDVTIGIASLPLAELLTKTAAGGHALPLTKDGKGRGIGGVLSAFAKLRTPVDGPEVRVTEDRRLTVAAWSDVVAAPPYAPLVEGIGSVQPIEELKEESTEKKFVSDALVKPSGGQQNSEVISTVASVDRFSKQLTEKELNDPFSVDLLQSNDVMDAELESIKADLAQCSDQDEQFNLNFRYELIERNLNILVMRVQNESLSLESYLDSIRERITRDQYMALHFKNSGETAVALKIMKRIKIMTEELKNAEA